MPKNRWIRTLWEDASGKTHHGHAGRRGYIVPGTKADLSKYVGKTYDGTEIHYADTVGMLQDVLDMTDVEDSDVLV